MLWNGNECGKIKTKVIRISRLPSSIQIMIDQKQLENVEYFNYLSSMITNDANCTHEIKSRIVMQKQHSTRRRVFSPANWT
jgi:hypothetical protein